MALSRFGTIFLQGTGRQGNGALHAFQEERENSGMEWERRLNMRRHWDVHVSTAWWEKDLRESLQKRFVRPWSIISGLPQTPSIKRGFVSSSSPSTIRTYPDSIWSVRGMPFSCLKRLTAQISTFNMTSTICRLWKG